MNEAAHFSQERRGSYLRHVETRYTKFHLSIHHNWEYQMGRRFRHQQLLNRQWLFQLMQSFRDQQWVCQYSGEVHRCAHLLDYWDPNTADNRRRFFLEIVW